MLEQLREIVQQVNSAKDLQSALDIIVVRVREVMATQVCSVYLFDKDMNAHVLMASRAEQRSRRPCEPGNWRGARGACGQTREPINLEDASKHPSFHYIQETGEESFRSFLGVPIIHHRNVLGVVVVQHEQQ